MNLGGETYVPYYLFRENITMLIVAYSNCKNKIFLNKNCLFFNYLFNNNNSVYVDIISLI